MSRKVSCQWIVCVLFLSTILCSSPLLAQNEAKFKKIFDGKTLENWDGNTDFWKVEDGAITGQTTKENPTKGNTFIIWEGGKVSNFELKLEYRIVGGNSGIQYRSFKMPNKKWVIGGYQADLEAGDVWSGALYGEHFRGILAKRGQSTTLTRDKNGKFKVEVVGSVGKSEEIQAKINKEDWNEYHIIASGNYFVHKINGVVTIRSYDHDKKERKSTGLLALQLHQGPPMKVQFRNIRFKEFKTATIDSLPKPHSQGREAEVEQGAGKKKIVLIAGRKSHGFGSHEHKAGCMLLAKALNESGLPVRAEVVTGGWPKDSSVLNDADTIVIYADGGGGHPFNRHLDEIDKLMKKGVGLVCIHYGVEVPKGKSGDAFLDWTGGYFEAHWSVNPHWVANYRKLPDHPTANGVKPFQINDEWYYHMRFRKNMQGVTPILSDLPPKSTLKRPDGAHSGNKFVREDIAKGNPQHMAWASERPDGGRGFGFTGGHFHWNWGHDEFRKLVLNAIVWTAKAKVPQRGVSSKRQTAESLLINQDYAKPKNFNPARIQKMLDEWNRKKVSTN